MVFLPFAVLISVVAVVLAALLEVTVKLLSNHFGGFGIVTSKVNWILLVWLWLSISVALSYLLAPRLHLVASK